MKKVYVLSFFLAVICIATNGQTPTWSWAKKLTGPFYDFSYDIAKDADGDIYVTGSFDSWLIYDGNDTLKSYGGRDGFLMKMGADGTIKKIMKIGSKITFSAAEEIVNCIAVDNEKNIYIAGEYNTDSLWIGNTLLRRLPDNFGFNNHTFIAKLDSNFQTLWAKPILSLQVDYPSRLKIDHDGNIYLTGKFVAGTVIDSDTVKGITLSGKMTVIKFNPKGDVLWSRNFGSSQEDNISDVGFDTNNDVYISGVFIGQGKFDNNITLSPPNSNEDGCIAKLSKTDGSLIWVKHITGIGKSFPTVLEVNNNNEVYVGGYFGANTNYKKDTLKIGAASVVAVTSDYEDIFLAKLDTAGNVNWLKSWGTSTSEYLYAMKSDAQNRLYLAAFTNSSTTIGGTYFSATNDVLIMQVDSLGNIVWVGKGGGPKSSDKPSDLVPLNDGNIFVCGQYNEITLFGGHTLTANTTYGKGQTDVYLAKLAAPLISSLGEAVSNEISFVVYPNPANTQVTVLTSGEITSLKLIDLNGKIVLSNNSVTESTFDISTLPQGLYVVEVESDGKLGRKKFIKE